MWLSAPVHVLIADRERQRIYMRQQNGNAFYGSSEVSNEAKREIVGEEIPRIDLIRL